MDQGGPRHQLLQGAIRAGTALARALAISYDVDWVVWVFWPLSFVAGCWVLLLWPVLVLQALPHLPCGVLGGPPADAPDKTVLKVGLWRLAVGGWRLVGRAGPGVAYKLQPITSCTNNCQVFPRSRAIAWELGKLTERWQVRLCMCAHLPRACLHACALHVWWAVLVWGCVCMCCVPFCLCVLRPA